MDSMIKAECGNAAAEDPETAESPENSLTAKNPDLGLENSERSTFRGNVKSGLVPY